MVDRYVLRAERIAGRKRLFGVYSESSHLCSHSTRCGTDGRDCRHKNEHEIGLHCLSHVCYNHNNGAYVHCVLAENFKATREGRIEDIWED